MTKTRNAFSLIELSIVVLIIGILIAGVMQTSRLIRQSKLSTAQTLTKSAPVSGITGLVFWLEPTLEDSFADIETENGTEVTHWNDINPQSSQKYFGVPIAGMTAPLYNKSDGPNGIPSLLFNGVDSSLEVAGSLDGLTAPAIVTINNNLTFFVVSRNTNNAADQVLISSGDGGAIDGWGFGIDSAASNTKIFSASTETGPYSSATTTAEISSNVVVINPDSTGPTNALSLFSYTNGATLFSPSHAIAIVTPSTTFHIGSRGLVGGNVEKSWNGYISEVIIYDHALKIEERQSVEDYLGKKYGVKVSKS
jgi:prepilin-type N-terminal cleavage/methylation domain-containing protein